MPVTSFRTDPQWDRGNPPNDATRALPKAQRKRRSLRQLLQHMWHVVVVMWAVCVINKFMFNLNVDQLAWVTGSTTKIVSACLIGMPRQTLLPPALSFPFR